MVDAGHTLVNSGVLAAPVVLNKGSIAGASYNAVLLRAAGSVINSGTGARISGRGNAVTDYARGLTVTNGGTIAGGTNGVSASGAAVVTNQGAISGAGYNGVYLGYSGGLVTNAGGARITGGRSGVLATSGPATVTNQGTLSGPAYAGVQLGAGGTVTNTGTAAVITGGLWGVYAAGGAATVVNSGAITGVAVDGVYLGAGGSVTNAAGAHISGGQNGVYATGGAATVTNAGTIAGTSGYGVGLGAGGTVTNSGTAARIAGGLWGIFAGSGAVTVANQGTIAGGSAGAIHFANANGNVLHLFPGAVVSGLVQGGTGSDTLELGSGATAGTISGIGSQFTGFEVLSVDGGAAWVLSGANTLLAAATVNLVSSDSLTVAGALVAPANLTVAGLGTLVASGGHMEVGTAGTATANQVVVDASHTLAMSGGPVMAITIGGTVANAGVIVVTGGHGAINGAITGAGTLQVNAGDGLALNGSSSTAGTVLDNGTLTIGASDSLRVSASVNPASTGLFVLTNASLLEVAADTGAHSQISFLGTSGDKLVVDAVASFGTNVGLGTYTGPLLENFGTLDVVDLKNLPFAGVGAPTYSAATGLLQLASGSVKATLSFQNSSLGSGTFHVATDGTGGVLVTHS